MSCCVILIHTTSNRIYEALTADDNRFNRVLGDGTAKQVTQMVDTQFNLNGGVIQSWKASLTDVYQYWCFLMDSFNYVWRSKFKMVGNIRQMAKDMIAHYAPDHEESWERRCESLAIEFHLSIAIL